MSDTTPIQTLSLDEAANFFGQYPPIEIALYSTFKEQYAACFKAGAEWQAKQQVVAIDEVELDELAGVVWQQDQQTNPVVVNPYAFVLGFKYGYKAALTNK